MTKKRGTSKVVTARNHSARRNTANAINQGLIALTFVNAMNARTMKLASHVPLNSCLKSKEKKETAKGL